ncbi:MAG: ABC transporter permease [Candidatus Eiseniibacteriota bacterium]
MHEAMRRHAWTSRWDGWTHAAAALVAVLYVLAAGAPFFAPYSADSMDRLHFYHPPQALHWRDPSGALHLRPFVYGVRLGNPGDWQWVEDRAIRVPMEFLPHGERYTLWPGVTWDRHLYGARGARVYLLGADAFGRDVWSRLVIGSRVSLGVGLAGIVISFTLGVMFGGLAGYLGGWLDATLMRLCELLLSLPGLYLIIALRTAFPSSMPGGRAYLMIVVILAVLGWAALARVIRGLVRAQREHDYVLAAEALGAGRLRVLVRHILPNVMSYVIVAATVAIPGYILGEVFLSFLGVGVQEPAASWGNMLGQARSLRVLMSFPWLLAAPSGAIFTTVMAFNVLGDGLRDALDPRGRQGGKAR